MGVQYLIAILLGLIVLGQCNLYQTCETVAFLNETYFYDLGPLYRPFNYEAYSYAFNSTHTYLFNVCGGTSDCNGANACLQGPQGDITQLSFASGFPAYTSEKDDILIMFSNSEEAAEQYLTAFYLFCSPSTFLNVVNVTSEYEVVTNSITFRSFIETSAACSTILLPPYELPRQWDNLSGEIFMIGKLPMFSEDAVSNAGTPVQFVGTFAYSKSLMSYRFDGIISNENGATSNVSYLVQGDADRIVFVSYVTKSGKSQPQCVHPFNRRIGNTNDLDWFGYWHNFRTNTPRNYTTLYFNKGETFEVNVWSGKKYPYVSMMQDTTGAPVFLGDLIIAPWAYTLQMYISEVNRASLSTQPVASAYFEIPTSWDCPARFTNKY